MTKENIKWIAIQPLTGGMYLGTENIIGHPAECIISFPGLTAEKKNKATEEVISCANEWYLTNYLKQHNRMPNYYVFRNRKMFQDDIIDSVILEDENNDEVSLTFDNIDLVVAVPVCSGLSSATIAPSDTKNSKNCNMKFITKYALSVIKPTIFIMENAPQLYTNTGTTMRTYFNDLAERTGYSIIYIKTDTQLHNNCQRRPRTFVMFVKGRTNSCPEIMFENKHIETLDYFNEIDKHITSQTMINGYAFSRLMLKYFMDMWGDNWRKTFDENKTGICNIINRDLYEDWKSYVDKNVTNEKDIIGFKKAVDHVKYKVSIGLGYYCDSPILPRNEYTPAIIFKTIPHIIHPSEDRFITIEEALALMGMPYDFSLCGHEQRDFNLIGQNVPVKTAEWVVRNAVDIIINPDKFNKRSTNILYANNIKQTYEEQ